MLFTIKRPKSQRFYQTSLRGFTPKGKNRPERFLKAWGEFFESLRTYLFLKVSKFFIFGGKLIFWLTQLPNRIKTHIIKRLIWSRGKLGRSIAMAFVMIAALSVFLFGEIFSSSKLVVSKEIDSDYLASASDIIPKRSIATTLIPEKRKQSESFAYEVQPGDTLSSIGNKFKISVDALKYVNSLSDYSVLKVGQEMTIPPISGLIHKVAQGDTLNSIATTYDVAPQAIADFNYILDTSKLALGTELVIPGGKVPEPVYTTTSAYVPTSTGAGGAPSANKDFCVWPTTVRIISQYFTWYHNGIDIATPLSGGMPPLLSCREGRVIRAGWDPSGLGLHVRIDHGNGYETVYGHMSRLDVGYGQKVSQGQIIGLMGSTGRSTGPHVHYMVKYNGVAQNPLNFMR